MRIIFVANLSVSGILLRTTALGSKVLYSYRYIESALIELSQHDHRKIILRAHALFVKVRRAVDGEGAEFVMQVSDSEQSRSEAELLSAETRCGKCQSLGILLM